MANLEIQIGADSSELNSEIVAAEAKIKRLGKLKVERVKLGLDVKELNSDINQAKAQLTSLNKSVQSTSQSFNAMTPKVANGGNALMQFSRIAQDAPYGIIGIGNNITATAEAFGHLSKSSGGTGNALKAVASSLLGTGGILLAVSLVTTALTYMSQNGITVSDVFKKITGDFDGYSDALKKVNEAVYSDKGVQSAISNVNELRINIDLAKNGFLDKEQVVKQYNETIGKTTGLVSTLDEAERQITKNGDAYIKMTLYKAAANLALEEAGKAALSAEKSRIKNLSEFTNAFLDADLTQTRSKEQYEAKQRNLQTQAKKRKAAEVKINQDAADQNVSIAKKFQSQAAKIATEFNFNLFDDTKAPSVKKVKAPKPEKYKNPNPNFDSGSGFIGGGIVNPNLGLVTPDLGVDEYAIAANEKLRLALELQKKTIEDFNKELGSIVTNGTVNALSGIGDAIGGALASGGNVIDAVGKSILGSMGSMLQELGKATIAYGVGLIAVKAAIKNPYLAVAAGVAMVALGSAMSKSVSKSSSSALGGGGSGSVQGGNSVSSPTSSTGGGGGSSFQGGTVVFEISGQSLIGVLGNTLDKNRRLGGSLGLG